MHFSKIAATAVLAGSVLAHRPGVVNDYPAIKRRDLVARDCTRNNLLRALIRFSAEASPFCSEYLGGSAVATVTETVAGETTVEDTATVTGEPEVIVITDIG